MSQPWPEGRGPLRFLPALLFRSDRPLLTIPLAWLLALAGSFAIGLAAAYLVPEAKEPDLGSSAIIVFIGVVILSPLIESLIMGGIIDMLMKHLHAWQAVLVSATGWGVVHSLFAPVWGLIIWWPFLIFSIIFVTWRPRGLWFAVGMATLVHALQNSLPAIAIVMGL